MVRYFDVGNFPMNFKCHLNVKLGLSLSNIHLIILVSYLSSTDYLYSVLFIFPFLLLLSLLQ